MSAGKSRSGDAPSRRSMSAKAITAAASSAARAGAEPTLATDATQSTPAHMTQSRPSGARDPRSAGIPARGPVRGRMRHVIAAATTMSGTITQNAPRQTPSPAKTPPTAGPDRAARPHAPEIVASIRGHRSSGNTSRTTPCTAAVIMPPPNPCRPRPPTRIGMLGASAHTLVPATRTAAAVSRVARVPVRRTTTELPALPRMAVTA